MAALPPREQALSLLAAVNNHGDLARKLSSLKQVKDILLVAEPFQAAVLFPYLVELQSSPESLFRKTLIEYVLYCVIPFTKDIGLKALEHFSTLVPVLLTLLNDKNSMVVKQSIITGTSIFYSVLEELALQCHRRGNVDLWLKELWTWMVKFKDAVIDILFEAASLSVKLLAVKFIEMNVVFFTSNRNDYEIFTAEAISRERVFNISWWAGHHPVLDMAALTSAANRSLGILLDMLQAASNLPGSVVNRIEEKALIKGLKSDGMIKFCVDQTPLPLLFMRTVIQTADAFPPLVDFIMELLSKLVSRQVWRMQKLWVGFLKCVSKTQPHSFRVLLQLPSPQLESALNKYGHLRGPLSTYASQPSVRNSLSRSTLFTSGPHQ